jgi:hypothetical protein
MKGKGILVFLVFLFVSIAAIDTYAGKHFLYWSIRWLDMPMHFLGGFWLGLGALWTYFYSGLFKAIPQEHRTARYAWLLAITSALVLGFIWEVYEYGLDILHERTDLYDMIDTLSDLLLDIIGGTVATFMFVMGNNHKKE